ncbi:hypothetical protein C0Q70_16187 [Pomacea canaliculata]|uniref:Major facilitator superfamily (MFS) profile domain-containing protein n=1 Tax=Pomacea canaliculata TaxID=400727 RepID=A0A2T7NP30_POMCA|nr:hypothetical protein C0Q70_16187 [Pomacea canaliculata]
MTTRLGLPRALILWSPSHVTHHELFLQQGDEKQVSQEGNKKSGRTTWPLIATVTCTLFGMSATGICKSALNSPQNFIKSFMNETAISRGHDPLTHEQVTSLYALLSAILALGSCVGSLLTQKVADSIGRKLVLLVIGVLGVVSALLMGLSVEARSPEMLFVGRAISGITIGFSTSLPPFFMAEVLPRHLVGPVLMASQMCSMMGSLAIAILSFDEIFATPELWPTIVGVHGVVCFLMLVLLPWVVQSPSFLLLAKNNEKAALTALQKLRGTSYVHEEISELKELALSKSKKSKLTVIQLLRDRSQARACVVSIGSFICWFFTGVVTVVFYSVILLQSAGLSLRVSRYMSSATIVLGIAVVVVLIFFIPRLKRRHMMLGGLAGMFLSELVLTLALVFRNQADWLKYVGIVCVPLIGMFHALGPAPLPWILLPELFDTEARGAASSVGVTTFYLSFFVVGYAFPPMQEAIGPYCILPFMGMSAFFFVFFFFFNLKLLDA